MKTQGPDTRFFSLGGWRDAGWEGKGWASQDRLAVQEEGGRLMGEWVLSSTLA